MAAAVVPRLPWCLTPGAAAHEQPTFWATVVCGGAGSGAPCVENNAKLARATDRRIGVARVIKRYTPLAQGRGRE